MLVRKRMGHKKELVFLGVIAVNFGIVGFLIFNNFIKKPQPDISYPSEEVSPLKIETDQVKEAGEGTELGQEAAETVRPEEIEGSIRELFSSFINEPLFKELKVHGDLPIKPGRTGRNNPFEFFALENPVKPMEEEKKE